MQTNPAAEQSKIIRWSESPWNQSGRKGKGLWRKRFEEWGRRSNSLIVILILLVSMWKYWSTLRQHSCLLRDSASASSKMSTDLCRSLLSVPLQLVTGWPGPVLNLSTMHTAVCAGDPTISNNQAILVFLLWVWCVPCCTVLALTYSRVTLSSQETYDSYN